MTTLTLEVANKICNEGILIEKNDNCAIEHLTKRMGPTLRFELNGIKVDTYFIPRRKRDLHNNDLTQIFLPV